MDTDEKVTEEEARKGKEAMMKFWNDGKRYSKILDKVKKNHKHDAKAPSTEDNRMEAAARVGVKVHNMGKAIRLYEAFNKEQMEELCRLVLESRSRFSSTNLYFVLVAPPQD